MDESSSTKRTASEQEDERQEKDQDQPFPVSRPSPLEPQATEDEIRSPRSPLPGPIEIDAKTYNEVQSVLKHILADTVFRRRYRATHEQHVPQGYYGLIERRTTGTSALTRDFVSSYDASLLDGAVTMEQSIEHIEERTIEVLTKLRNNLYSERLEVVVPRYHYVEEIESVMKKHEESVRGASADVAKRGPLNPTGGQT